MGANTTQARQVMMMPGEMTPKPSSTNTTGCVTCAYLRFLEDNQYFCANRAVQFVLLLQGDKRLRGLAGCKLHSDKQIPGHTGTTRKAFDEEFEALDRVAEGRGMNPKKYPIKRIFKQGSIFDD
jgi:hypothetical protein